MDPSNTGAIVVDLTQDDVLSIDLTEEDFDGLVDNKETKSTKTKKAKSKKTKSTRTSEFLSDVGDVTLVSIDPGEVNIALAILKREGQKVVVKACLTPDADLLAKLQGDGPKAKLQGREKKVKMSKSSVHELLRKTLVGYGVTAAVIESQISLSRNYFRASSSYRFAQQAMTYFESIGVPCSYVDASKRRKYFSLKHGKDHDARKRISRDFARSFSRERPDVVPPGPIADAFCANDHNADAVLQGLAVLGGAAP